MAGNLVKPISIGKGAAAFGKPGVAYVFPEHRKQLRILLDLPKKIYFGVFRVELKLFTGKKQIVNKVFAGLVVKRIIKLEFSALHQYNFKMQRLNMYEKPFRAAARFLETERLEK